MDFPKLKEHLGEEWLDEQVSIIEKGFWIKDSKGLDRIELISAGYFILRELDKLIFKFEKITGFNQWVREAKAAKSNFNDFLFELRSMEIFIDGADSVELKKINENSGKSPEAFLRKGVNAFFIECTNITNMSGIIENKAKKLFDKSRQKFKGSEGIHLVGTMEMFDKDTMEQPNPSFKLLKWWIMQKFEKREGSTVIAFILINFYVQINPKENNKISLNHKYWIILNPNKTSTHIEEFFKDIITKE